MARLGGEYVGRKAGGALCRRSRRPTTRSGAMIQRYLKGWQLHPPDGYLWEMLPLQVLLRQPDSHGQFDPLWIVQRQRGRNGRIQDNLTLGVRTDQFEASV